MELLYKLKDEEFEFKGIKAIRNVVRGIVLNNEGKIALHHVFGLYGEEFGFRDYYETPGGGVKRNEDLVAALKRECLEELGYEIEILCEIGEVDDYYNLLERKNLNHYFLCKIKGEKKDTDFVSKGDSLIKETVWVSLSEAKLLYDSHKTTPLSRLVCNREYPILTKTGSILKNLRTDI